ncbi:MAG: hypothetical protein DWQ06_08990 [Calditrichaeota bacterium]|nr:MAG: hypothetical protein DWQ06_08990 [Calditrichota bacterium]
MFQNVVGQNRVKDFFTRVIREDRLSHAYIFSGMLGVGKSAVAFELAKILNCPNNNCGVCPDCIQVSKLQHQNLHLVYPLPSVSSKNRDDHPLKGLSERDIEQIKEEISAKAKNPYHRIVITKAREILTQSIRHLSSEVSFSISKHNYNFVIIFQADTMNEHSANAFLKLLEEPPQKTIFILLTDLPKNLLTTILSRCQLIRFDLLSEAEIVESLVSQGYTKEESEKVALISNGSLKNALENLNINLTEKFDLALNFLRVVAICDPQKVISLAKTLSKSERSELINLLRLMMSWFTDCLILKGELTERKLVFEPYKENLEKFIERYKFANLQKAVELLEKAIDSINRNVYINLLLTDLMIQLNKTIIAR